MAANRPAGVAKRYRFARLTGNHKPALINLINKLPATGPKRRGRACAEDSVKLRLFRYWPTDVQTSAVAANRIVEKKEMVRAPRLRKIEFHGVASGAWRLRYNVGCSRCSPDARRHWAMDRKTPGPIGQDIVMCQQDEPKDRLQHY